MPRSGRAVIALLLALVPGAAAAAQGLRQGAAVAAIATDEAWVWAARIDEMARRDELRLAAVQPDPDFPGRRHLRYEQRVRGVRVFGAQLVRQVDEAGRTLTVFGRLQEGLEADTAPALGAAEAARRAEAAMGGGAQALGETELVLLPLLERVALAFSLWARIDHRLERFFLDAHGGAVLWRYDDLPTSAAVGLGTGVWGDRKKVSADAVSGGFRADDRLRPPALSTYDLKSNLSAANVLLGTGVIDPSYLAASPDNEWRDGPVVDAHVYAGYTYDYYFRRHGRRGIDGRDLPMHSIVHFTPPGVDFANAFWDPASRAMFYGNGDASYGPFSGAIDVVAHELTHGVTQFTWAGLYNGESGALNEAFSDIMGTAVEFYFQPPGNGRLQADYYLGEDLAFGFDPPTTAIRSMENPSIFCNIRSGCDADHYSRRFRGEFDSGGVHHNSGIASQAFYLLVEGGVNRTSGMRVEGLGSANRERAEKIFYRGFTTYLTPAATFADARAATLQAARDLYGTASREAAQVEAAWAAVGVF